LAAASRDSSPENELEFNADEPNNVNDIDESKNKTVQLKHAVTHWLFVFHGSDKLF
jgi:hypothetical protein